MKKKDKCSICAEVKSKLKLNRCKCGKKAVAGHFQIMVDWHVSCPACEQWVGDFETYDEAVLAWNKANPKKKSK